MTSAVAPSRLVGILGGMGPAATSDFYAKLIELTPATTDQEHLRVVMWADPTVPSRQEALLSGGTDPTPWLVAGVDQLERCGAEIVVVPCNTVHGYLPRIMDNRNVEFISIIDATIASVERQGIVRVGLLATDGALAAGVFQSAFDRAGIEWLLPSPEQQQTLMGIVYKVKAGEHSQHVLDQLDWLLAELHAQGVATVVVGCTEISSLLDAAPSASDVDVIDPAIELARATIKRAMEGLHDGEMES